MAKTIGLYSLAAPTNLGLSLVAGGSLLPNTTYYYRIFACESKFGSVVISPRTATVSITTTTTNKSIKLTWTAIPGYTPSSAEGNCYHILRNTVDSFLDTDAVLMMTTSSDTSSRKVTGVTYTDTGSNHVDHCFPNFKGGLPTIYVTSGADEWVSMWDIYQADLAAGWGRVLPSINTTFLDFGSEKAAGGNYYSMANIAIGYDSSGNAATGYFTHSAGALVIYGALSSSNSAYVNLGALINTADGDTMLRTFMANYGSNFQVGTLGGILTLYGLSNIVGGCGWPADYFHFNNGNFNSPLLDPAEGSKLYDCDFPYTANGWVAQGTVEARNCRYGGIGLKSSTHLIAQPRLVQGNAIGFQFLTDQTITEPLVTFADYDIAWKTAYNGTIYDGTFLSHNRTDGKAWIYMATSLTPGGSLTFKYSLKLRVSDSNDNPLSGAAVVVKDLSGATVASGNTDADGIYDAGYLINRILNPTASVIGHTTIAAALEDDHITSGFLTRTYNTPHTLTITATGYQEYQDTITLNRKLELELALGNVGNSPANLGLVPLGVKQVTI
jgi:hypothetical protein